VFISLAGAFILETAVLMRCIIAGTGLAGVQVVMTQDEGCGVLTLQEAQEGHDAAALLDGARVSGVVVGCETALVTDTDAVGIVALAMCACLGDVATSMDDAVARDVIVIADVAESSMLHVVTAAILRRKGFPFRRGAAMDDDEGDDSHF
jgi:hypothetical protein